ncbi:MAG: hypothetical protein K1X67_11235 [Fimbriimonadaceae bacterium]|nr:hypothetical protein [Fimbriimonadaceae bacterium]
MDYEGKKAPDGALVFNVRSGLTLNLDKTFDAKLKHRPQNERCAQLPHVAEITIHWGDKTGRTVPYDDPDAPNYDEFYCA